MRGGNRYPIGWRSPACVDWRFFDDAFDYSTDMDELGWAERVGREGRLWYDASMMPSCMPWPDGAKFVAPRAPTAVERAETDPEEKSKRWAAKRRAAERRRSGQRRVAAANRRWLIADLTDAERNRKRKLADAERSRVLDELERDRRRWLVHIVLAVFPNGIVRDDGDFELSVEFVRPNGQWHRLVFWRGQGNALQYDMDHWREIITAELVRLT